MPTFRRSFPAAALGLALVLSGCGGHPTVRRAIAVVPATATAGASYSPATITVSKDDNVILAVGNPKTMGAALLDTAGGQTWGTLQSFGLLFDVNTKDSMLLPAAKRTALRSAHVPAGRR